MPVTETPTGPGYEFEGVDADKPEEVTEERSIEQAIGAAVAKALADLGWRIEKNPDA